MATTCGVVELVIVVVADIKDVERGCADRLDGRKIRHAVKHVTNLHAALEHRRGAGKRQSIHGKGERDKSTVVGGGHEDHRGFDAVGFRHVDRECGGRDVVGSGIHDRRIVGNAGDLQVVDERHREDFGACQPRMRVVAINDLAIADADLGAGGVDAVVTLLEVDAGQLDVMVVLAIHTADVGIARLQGVSNSLGGRDRRLLRRTRRDDRNVVKHGDRKRTGTERNAIAIAVRCHNIGRQIDRLGVFSVIAKQIVERRMVDLILQREDIGTVRADRQDENFAIARVISRRAVVDIAVQTINVGHHEDMAPVGFQAGVDWRRDGLESKAAETVGAEIDQRLERTGCPRRNGGVGAGDLARTAVVRVGIRQTGRVQTVFIDVRSHRTIGNQRRAVVVEVDISGNICGC